MKNSGRPVLPIRISGRFFDAGGERWRLIEGGGSRRIMPITGSGRWPDCPMARWAG
ncbi:hypothetical protein N826_26970 [Skermanella aerolata KACC 11604]|nr:hypothetical protein N826_26970 [Skermanella aerolata KACC 11604]